MGKRLDAWLGRGFKIEKFKATVSLAVARLAVLKNLRQSRCSIARSDVVEFLKTNNHERALMRVEQVIKEQNMLDVFVFVDGYCHLLLERVNLIEQEKSCPEEIQEAASSLIYAAARCGEFPELQEIRAILTARFGKEFAARAVELRNNCGVNPKVIQKLSPRKPSYEDKMKMVKEIASDNNIDLPVEMEQKESSQEEKQIQGPSGPSSPTESTDTSMRRRKYKDVADAAQAAFESAAYAAEAARAAVELSRSGSTDPDGSSGGPHTPGSKTRPVQNYDSEANEDDVVVMTTGATERSLSDSSSGSHSDKDGEIKKQGEEVVFDDESEDEGGKRVDEDLHHSQVFDEEKTEEIKEPLNIYRRPISVRTTRIH